MVFALATALAACGGGEASPDTSFDDAEAVTLSGAVTYDFVPTSEGTGGLQYDLTERRPVRSARAVALDSRNNELASATLDDAGRYSLRVPRNTQVRVRVEAVLKKTTGLSRWDIEVRDNVSNNALYVLDGRLVSTGDEASLRNLHAPSGWDGTNYTGPRAAAPFTILDTIYNALTFIEDVDSRIQLPALTVNWSSENRSVSGDRSQGEIGQSSYSPSLRAIFILGLADNDTDEYDPSVITHEFGHFLEDTVFTSNSIGGSHDFFSFLDMRVAFSEGFGNAFASMVLGDPLYTDSFGNRQAVKFAFSVEDELFSPSRTVLNNGWYSEAAVQILLYDVFDDEQDSGDELAVGFSPIYNALTSDIYTQGTAFSSVFKFAEAFIDSAPASRRSFERMLDIRGINSTDSYALGETDDATSRFTLPIYKTLTEGPVPVTLCTNNVLGDSNKVDNVQFVRLRIITPGLKTMSVNSGFRDGVRDVARVIITRDGELFRSFEFDLGTAPEENTVFFDRAGDYAIAYSERLNTDSDSQTGGEVCANLFVNE